MKKVLTIEEYLTEQDGFVNDEMFEAARRRDPAIVEKEQQIRIKDSIQKYGELMKKYPEKASLYKAQVELAMAKAQVLDARAKVEQLRDR